MGTYRSLLCYLSGNTKVEAVYLDLLMRFKKPLMKQYFDVLKESFLLLVLLLISIPAYSESTNKIGVILPLSGGWASWGHRVQDALELYREQHPKENLQFHYQDEKTCDSKESLNGYKAIRLDESVKVIIVGCKNGTSAILPLAKHDEVLLLSSGFQEQSHFANNNKTLVNFALQIQDEAESIGNEINQKQVKRLGLIRITGTDDFILGMKKVLPESTIAYDEVVDSDTLDFNTIDAKIHKANLDGIFLSLDENQLLSFYKVFRERERTQRLFSLYSIEGLAQTNSKLKTISTGTIYASPFSHSKKSLEATNFQAKFIEKFKEAPTINSYFVTDGLRDLAIARENCLNKTSECLFLSLANGLARNGISGAYKYKTDGSVERIFEIRVVD